MSKGIKSCESNWFYLENACNRLNPYLFNITMKTINHFVNGKSFTGNSKKVGKVFNPATGEQSAEVRLASTKDVNEAIANAKNAFESWSNKPPLQRARIMFKFKELIEKNSDELTKIIVSEHGKVYEDAKGSLTRGLEVVEYACGIPQMLKGEFTENVGTNVDSWSGIRIENDIVVTMDKPNDLMADIPREVEEIEALMAK